MSKQFKGYATATAAADQKDMLDAKNSVADQKCRQDFLSAAASSSKIYVLIDVSVVAYLKVQDFKEDDSVDWKIHPKLHALIKLIIEETNAHPTDITLILVGKRSEVASGKIMYWERSDSKDQFVIEVDLTVVRNLFNDLVAEARVKGLEEEIRTFDDTSHNNIRKMLGRSNLKRFLCFSRDEELLKTIKIYGGETIRFGTIGEVDKETFVELQKVIGSESNKNSIKHAFVDIDDSVFHSAESLCQNRVVLNSDLQAKLMALRENKFSFSVLTARSRGQLQHKVLADVNVARGKIQESLDQFFERFVEAFSKIKSMVVKDISSTSWKKYEELFIYCGEVYHLQCLIDEWESDEDKDYVEIFNLLSQYQDYLQKISELSLELLNNMAVEKMIVSSALISLLTELANDVLEYLSEKNLPYWKKYYIHFEMISVRNVVGVLKRECNLNLSVDDYSYTNAITTRKPKVSTIKELVNRWALAGQTGVIVLFDDSRLEVIAARREIKAIKAEGFTFFVVPIYSVQHSGKLTQQEIFSIKAFIQQSANYVVVAAPQSASHLSDTKREYSKYEAGLFAVQPKAQDRKMVSPPPLKSVDELAESAVALSG